jgi:hypothetical protein
MEPVEIVFDNNNGIFSPPNGKSSEMGCISSTY